MLIVSFLRTGLSPWLLTKSMMSQYKQLNYSPLCWSKLLCVLYYFINTFVVPTSTLLNLLGCLYVSLALVSFMKLKLTDCMFVSTVVQMKCWPRRIVKVSIIWSTQHTDPLPLQLESSSLRSMSCINEFYLWTEVRSESVATIWC